MTSTKLLVGAYRKSATKSFSTSSASLGRHYKLLIVGSGSGGCATASKFSKKLGAGHVGIIEPKDDHYYQPWFTLVGGGIKKVEDSGKKMSEVIPKKADWLKTTAEAFDPKNCTVTTATGEEIKYDFLVMACGLQLNYNLIKGLPEGFDKDPMLCSNYDYEYVQKTWPAIQKFKGGNAIFTMPNTPVKCAGAPQKIMYLAEEAWQKSGVRDKSTVMYNTSLSVLFGVKKYAAGLHKVVDSRDIKINYQRNLIEVNTDKREAIFQKLDSPGETQTYKYDFMHITPPMSTPDPVRKSCLVDEAGYVDVDQGTLQHKKYPNIFAIGDCFNAPTSKTAAAAASQSGYLEKNLTAVMSGKPAYAKYDGYTSCPLITGREKCIMAEFNYDSLPLETFPIDQGKERRSMYHVKKDIIPIIYWNMMLKGYWNGPAAYRKLMHLGTDGPEKLKDSY
ncbi:sulfide:quinone oxidoreductase [Mytilus galloprovincialis]|uniref:Sulfide:quinone oxidoreductase, mitochondrial n=1 Tax=Mytilus galloprovincialis TaxID=29158 RepID=A0A8B6HA03_MYTGA|nr:sulfide:quinone oxidoreductase [Mytilus galloprovincialis]